MGRKGSAKRKRDLAKRERDSAIKDTASSVPAPGDAPTSGPPESGAFNMSDEQQLPEAVGADDSSFAGLAQALEPLARSVVVRENASIQAHKEVQLAQIAANQTVELRRVEAEEAASKEFVKLNSQNATMGAWVIAGVLLTVIILFVTPMVIGAIIEDMSMAWEIVKTLVTLFMGIVGGYGIRGAQGRKNSQPAIDE